MPGQGATEFQEHRLVGLVYQGQDSEGATMDWGQDLEMVELDQIV